MKKPSAQYAERQKRDHVNLKEKEYAIYAAKGKADEAETNANTYTDAAIAAAGLSPKPGLACIIGNWPVNLSGNQ